MDPTRRAALRRQALRLVWIGELWNVLEAVVALWSGIGAGSVALVAFGLDSFVELFAGAVLIVHLRRDLDGAEDAASDRRAHRLLAVTFFVLSGYIVFQSLATLGGWLPRPAESLVGILLVVASAVVMSVLYVRKRSLARDLNSRALRAEAIETLVCDVQDLTVVVGLGLNALVGWWWADPIAAIALVPLLVREGWEGLSGPHEES
ncbi:MAG TPA: cation transporter [Thermoplasmata archaeon]|nr:cation transporter [Thermoplasmata archaeon]